MAVKQSEDQMLKTERSPKGEDNGIQTASFAVMRPLKRASFIAGTVTLSIFLFLMPNPSLATSEYTETRTSPYDFGCMQDPYSTSLCAANSEPQRQGLLTEGDVTSVWPTYSPFPTLGTVRQTSYTGVYVHVPIGTIATLTVWARFRATEASLVRIWPQVCIGVWEPGQYAPNSEACASVAGAAFGVVSVAAEGLNQGTYFVKVYPDVRGLYGAGIVSVDEISYRLQFTESGLPSAIQLTPSNETMTAYPGVTYTAEARVSDEFGNPVSGQRVQFEISSGPNFGNEGFCDPVAHCVTDTDGKAKWFFNSNGETGTDYILAFVDTNANGQLDCCSEVAATATVVWESPT